MIHKPTICPFCDSSLFFVELNENDGFYEITCPHCGALMKKKNEEASAIEELNMRAENNPRSGEGINTIYFDKENENVEIVDFFKALSKKLMKIIGA